jgi:anaerobic magnesium-protoporphyrin IX monomethyl ester cyclase
VAQIKHLAKTYGIRQIQFYDDTFTVNKRACLEFCRLLEQEKLGITWTAYIRGDCFSDSLAQAMKRAGCHQVLMGIETGSPEIARRINKPIEHARYKEAVEIAHRYGLEVRGSFIIGNMDETWATMQETLDFAIELDIDLFQLSISTPYPGTALYNEGVSKGWIKDFDWYHYGQGRVLVEQPQISAEDIYRFERYAFRRFYLRSRTILRMLRRVATPRQIRDYMLSASILLLGLHRKKRQSDWSGWLGLREEDFQDVALGPAEALRLTYELRQGAAAA